MKKITLDRTDRRILALLQEAADTSISAIAQQVGLSTTPCWRRIQKLEKSAVIEKRVALLNRDELDLGVDVFVAIRTQSHNDDWLSRFDKVIQGFPEIVECYRMSGDIDYLLRVVCRDIDAYDAFYQRLIRRIELSDVSSSFAMERMKFTTALPLKT